MFQTTVDIRYAKGTYRTSVAKAQLRYRTYPIWPQWINKEDFCNEFKAWKRKINDGLQQPSADEYAHELIGGYFWLKRVRRAVGFFTVSAG